MYVRSLKISGQKDSVLIEQVVASSKNRLSLLLAVDFCLSLRSIKISSTRFHASLSRKRENRETIKRYVGISDEEIVL